MLENEAFLVIILTWIITYTATKASMAEFKMEKNHNNMLERMNFQSKINQFYLQNVISLNIQDIITTINTSQQRKLQQNRTRILIRIRIIRSMKYCIEYQVEQETRRVFRRWGGGVENDRKSIRTIHLLLRLSQLQV